MITQNEDSIVMKKSRLYDIVWAIEKLDIPEGNRPRSIMVRRILAELYSDYKELRKGDKRIERTEIKAKAKELVEE